MIAAFSAVFAASLLGSGHCAGMCGAFLAVAVAPPSPPLSPAADSSTARSGRGRTLQARGSLLAAYNGGRLITYSALGAAAGAVGAVVDLGGSLIGLQRAATVAAGAFILAFGVVALLRQLNVPIARAPIPAVLQRIVIRAHRAADRLPAPIRALTIGLLTTLLPCGWLWAFVITASGTADPLLGVAVMGAFWLGTLPIMLSLGVGIQALTGRLGVKLPVLTSVLLVAVGLFTVAGRLAVPAMAMPSTVHEGATSLEVPDPDEPPPCPLCHPEGRHGR